MSPKGRPLRRRRVGARSTFNVDLEFVHEVEREARRLDRSVSWVVRKAWSLALARIRAMPSVK